MTTSVKKILRFVQKTGPGCQLVGAAPLAGAYITGSACPDCRLGRHIAETTEPGAFFLRKRCWCLEVGGYVLPVAPHVDIPPRTSDHLQWYVS